MSLTDAAGAVVDEHAGDWTEKGLAAARKALDKRREAVDASQNRAATTGGQIEQATLGQASVALAGLSSRQPSLVVLGKDLAARVLLKLGAGEAGEARRLALADGTASFDERRAASAVSTGTTTAKTSARERAADDLEAWAKDVGEGAVRAAIPFVLAAVL